MSSSRLIARLLGGMLFVSGVGILLNSDGYRATAEEFLRGVGLIYMSGVMALLGGLAVVNVHNVWTRDWRLLVTLIGWFAVIDGTLRVVVPQFIAAFDACISASPASSSARRSSCSPSAPSCVSRAIPLIARLLRRFDTATGPCLSPSLRFKIALRFRIIPKYNGSNVSIGIDNDRSAAAPRKGCGCGISRTRRAWLGTLDPLRSLAIPCDPLRSLGLSFSSATLGSLQSITNLMYSLETV
jgi:hypothetical protein